MIILIFIERYRHDYRVIKNALEDMKEIIYPLGIDIGSEELI